jgi:hypothetical protein
MIKQDSEVTSQLARDEPTAASVVDDQANQYRQFQKPGLGPNPPLAESQNSGNHPRKPARSERDLMPAAENLCTWAAVGRNSNSAILTGGERDRMTAR